MKNIYLTIIVCSLFFNSFSQSNYQNIAISVFNNNIPENSRAPKEDLKIAIKPIFSSYAAIPVAEDFILFLMAPKTKFAREDVLKITGTNKSIFGTRGTMICQEVIDLGGTDIYFPLVLHAPEGMKLSSLAIGEWSYAFTVSFSSPKNRIDCSDIKIVGDGNNSELRKVTGGVSLYSSLSIGGINQLKFSNNNSPVVQLPKEQTELQKDISVVFPNPATTMLNLSISDIRPGQFIYRITDLFGKQIMVRAISVGKGQATISIDISQLSKGLYYIKGYLGGEVFKSEKFIKL